MRGKERKTERTKEKGVDRKQEYTVKTSLYTGNSVKKKKKCVCDINDNTHLCQGPPFLEYHHQT